MFSYIVRRLLGMIPILLLISLVTFVIIQLPPGDFDTSYASNLAAMGDTNSQEALDNLRATYGLDQPVLVQYVKWISNIVLHGNYAISFEFKEPVTSLIWDSLWLTVWLSVGSILLAWLIAFPIGIYSAVKQYSIGDYFFTLLGFIGVSVPAFLIALVIMYLQFKYLGKTTSGL